MPAPVPRDRSTGEVVVDVVVVDVDVDVDVAAVALGGEVVVVGPVVSTLTEVDVVAVRKVVSEATGSVAGSPELSAPTIPTTVNRMPSPAMPSPIRRRVIRLCNRLGIASSCEAHVEDRVLRGSAQLGQCTPVPGPTSGPSEA